MSDTCPPLPSGSVNLSKLHAAARQNHDLDKAIAEQVEARKPAEPAAAETHPADPPAATPAPTATAPAQRGK